MIRYLPLMIVMAGCSTLPSEVQLPLEEHRANLIKRIHENVSGDYNKKIDEQANSPTKITSKTLLPDVYETSPKGSKNRLIYENITKLYSENHKDIESKIAKIDTTPELVCNDPNIDAYKAWVLKQQLSKYGQFMNSKSNGDYLYLDTFNNFNFSEKKEILNYDLDQPTITYKNVKLVKGTCEKNILNLNKPIVFFMTFDVVGVEQKNLDKDKRPNINYKLINLYERRYYSIVNLADGKISNDIQYGKVDTSQLIYENNKLIDINEVRKNKTIRYLFDADNTSAVLGTNNYKTKYNSKIDGEQWRDDEEKFFRELTPLSQADIANINYDKTLDPSKEGFENLYQWVFYDDNNNIKQATGLKKFPNGNFQAHGVYRNYQNNKITATDCFLNGWKHNRGNYLGYGLDFCRPFSNTDIANFVAADKERGIRAEQRAVREWEEEQAWRAKLSAEKEEARRQSDRYLATVLNQASANFQKQMNGIQAQTARTYDLVNAANRANLSNAYPGVSGGPGARYSTNSNSSTTGNSNSVPTIQSSKTETKNTADNAQIARENEKKQQEEERLIARKKAEDLKQIEMNNIEQENKENERKLLAKKKEQERQLKLEQEARDKKRNEQLFFTNTANNIRLSARKCPDGEGKYFVVGIRPKRSNSDPVSCIDVQYRANCPGSKNYVTGTGKNFLGAATDCFMGDTYRMPEKLDCEAKEVQVKVTKVTACS
jgi:hypothetical protein